MTAKPFPTGIARWNLGNGTSYADAVNQRSVMSFGAMKDQTLTWTVAGAKLDVLVTQASYDEETGQVQFYGDDWQGVPCLLVAPAVSRAEAAELLAGYGGLCPPI